MVTLAGKGDQARTGLPYTQDLQHHGNRYLIANNRCAGLPNFTARRHGVITRSVQQQSAATTPTWTGLYDPDPVR